MNVEWADSDDQLKADLEPLIAAGDRWRVDLGMGRTTVRRGWQDGTVDWLFLFSPDFAYAMREDPQGRWPWSMAGTRRQLIGWAMRLAATGSWGAPPVLAFDLPRTEWR